MMRSFLVSLFLLGPVFSAASTENMNLISVNGVAETSVDPNLVILQIDSWGKAPGAKAAQETQVRQYEKIKATLEKYKIKKEDFRTENFSVNPDYLYDSKTQQNKINGYRVSHQISITFRKIEEAGQLIDDLTAAGKNDSAGGVSIQSTSWDYDKKSVVESSVINDAVRSARAKAEELAKAAGVKIKGVHRISHTVGAPTVVPAQLMMKTRMNDAASAPTELSSGQIKIRVDVQMEFEI